jgi:hypothetical protein
MEEVDIVLEQIYLGHERLSHTEIYRRVVAADGPTELVTALDALPEGEYALDELAEALELPTDGYANDLGIPAGELTDEDLHRELAELHRTRNDTLRHGSEHALVRHSERMAELEAEYLLRFPRREVDPGRLREGARRRAEPGGRRPATGGAVRVRTGAEQPWDPEDLAVAEGRDPTPDNVARARRELAEHGAAAVERTVP